MRERQLERGMKVEGVANYHFQFWSHSIATSLEVYENTLGQGEEETRGREVGGLLERNVVG